MGLESATTISGLVPTNPTNSDHKSEGDDHLRLIKAVLQASLPTASKAWYNPTIKAKSADFSVLAADMNCVFFVDTTAGNVTATLPTLGVDDGAWECSFIKYITNTSALFIAPASGTLVSGDISGLAKTRRCLVNVRTTAIWSSSGWFITRAIDVPVGTVLSFEGASLPIGFEWPNGQTLAGAAGSIYPEYWARKGSLIVSDLRGRIEVSKDNLGGSAASRVTSAGSGIDGATLAAVGGVQNVVLDTTTIPAHSHASPTISQPLHGHNISIKTDVVTAGGGAAKSVFSPNGVLVPTGAGVTLDPSATGDALSATTGSIGGGLAHSNMPPSIIMNKILVVE